MKRNNNVLSLRKLQSRSLAGAANFNKTCVSNFFAKYEEVCSKYKFLTESIFNIDEKGITTVYTPELLEAKKQVGTMTT